MGHTQGTETIITTRDGRRLYAQLLRPRTDVARPTVVFEAGSGASRSSWAWVQPKVARFATAVVYDRSGLGRSEPDPVGRTIDRMADDLSDVLDALGPGPFVLVGHSAGAPIVRLAASRGRDRVAGLVLVDPTDEASDLLVGRGFRLGERVVLPIQLLLAHLGLLRPLFRWMLDAAPAADVRDDLAREGFGPGVVRTMMAQSRTFLDEVARWRDAPPDLGDIPVTVVSGALSGTRGGMPKSIRASANAAAAFRAAQSPRGRHVLAPDSDHYVPVTDAALIADEIERLVGQA